MCTMNASQARLDIETNVKKLKALANVIGYNFENPDIEEQLAVGLSESINDFTDSINYAVEFILKEHRAATKERDAALKAAIEHDMTFRLAADLRKAFPDGFEKDMKEKVHGGGHTTVTQGNTAKVKKTVDKAFAILDDNNTNC